jgi:pyruvate formate lyase activating enzyme
LVGRLFSVAEVLDAAERDRPFVDESGGGLTFSGGEPLYQPRFLLACLTEARRRGLHTAVDTGGFASLAIVREVASLADLFLFDVKVLDPARHLRFTGVPLEPIVRNLRALDEAGAAIWLRMPFIPGYNADEENLRAVGTLATSLRQTRRIHLLPYHRLGAEKFARLGRTSPMPEVTPPPPAEIEKAAALLRTYDLDVHVGG